MTTKEELKEKIPGIMKEIISDPINYSLSKELSDLEKYTVAMCLKDYPNSQSASVEKTKEVLVFTKNILSDLSENVDDSEESVKRELEGEVAECEREINKLEREEKYARKWTHDSKSDGDYIENPYIYFTSKYFMQIKRAPDRSGILIINDEKIFISHIEADISFAMGTQLIQGWNDITNREPIHVGWVSYSDFIASVDKWIGSDSIIGKDINRAIDRLRDKIKAKIGTDNGLIENGRKFGWKNHYRFIVIPDNIILHSL